MKISENETGIDISIKILDTSMMGLFQTCSQCNNMFKTKKLLTQHEKRVHGPKLSCNMCAFKAVRKDKLESHKRERHYNGQRTDCDQCYKSFANKDSLKVHKNVIHIGKIFPCDQCDYTNGYLGGLKSHKERVHEEKSFECSCGSLQNGKAAFNIHIKYKCGKNLNAANVM